MKQLIQSEWFTPSTHGHEILVMQSPNSRAINVGYIKGSEFIPGRLNLGAFRQKCTYQATIEAFQLPHIQEKLKYIDPETISTVTLLREALSHNLSGALYESGIKGHFGDAFIGVTHDKSGEEIKATYSYENTEGLAKDGFWIIADSICKGRNLIRTLESLLSQFHPKELLFLAPIASRQGIELVGNVLTRYDIPATFVAWGGLIGVDAKTGYDMPWGHPDTQALDPRDRQVFIDMYGEKLCMGGDFGNDFYCPPLALELYHEQLREHGITPHIPSVEEIKKIYLQEEILTIS